MSNTINAVRNGTLRVLIIDDKQEEIDRATMAVKEAGHIPVILQKFDYNTWEDMEQVDLILTDLYFNPADRRWSSYQAYEENQPPMGLVVALHALAIGKPVAICTDEAHHGAKASFIYDSYVRYATNTIGFVWEDRKDWAGALSQLLK